MTNFLKKEICKVPKANENLEQNFRLDKKFLSTPIISISIWLTNDFRFIKQNCLTKILSVNEYSKLFLFLNQIPGDSLRSFFQSIFGRQFTFIQSCLLKQSVLIFKFTSLVHKTFILTKRMQSV